MDRIPMLWESNFTTLFNKNYLAKGIALCKSLENVCNSFHLYVFAFDDETAEVVSAFLFKNVSIIKLEQLENYCPALLKVKQTRTLAEYCWTCKGPSMQYCLDSFNLKSICYLDSDLFFYNSPDCLFEEAPEADTLLTRHDFYGVKDLGETNGYHCAQFMAFKNNPNGRSTLDWWTSLCLDWCFNRHEPGRFGDQKYLDSFQDRWDNIHDISGGCCGPWNIQRYRVYSQDGKLVLKERSSLKPLVFYHFHFLRNKVFTLYEEMELGHYKYSHDVRELIYSPYIGLLRAIEKQVRAISPLADALGSRTVSVSKIRQILHLGKIIFKENIIVWKRR